MPETFHGEKETIVSSHWKKLVCGLGAAAVLLAGCQKSETAGGGASPQATAVAGSASSAAPAVDAARLPIRVLHVPKEGDTVAAGSWAFGWALDDSGIAQVTVVSDTGLTAPVATGQSFPGVAQTYPNYPDPDKAGFGFEIPKLPPGPHVLTVTFVAKDGGRLEIKRHVQVK